MTLESLVFVVLVVLTIIIANAVRNAILACVDKLFFSNSTERYLAQRAAERERRAEYVQDDPDFSKYCRQISLP